MPQGTKPEAYFYEEHMKFDNNTKFVVLSLQLASLAVLILTVFTQEKLLLVAVNNHEGHETFLQYAAANHDHFESFFPQGASYLSNITPSLP